MPAKYIIRFDDFCPTMNWEVWEQIEVILFKHHIKPIIAVVPDNQDPILVVNPPNPHFWARVRAWQAAGWTIAIHGHHHVYSNSDSGLMKINNYSEFAGLPYEEQYQKLATGLAIFAEHQVKADAWIAPAHSFDDNTIKALVALNIKVISDGFYFRPVMRKGMIWIPQQLWRFKTMSYGFWTVCRHHNSYSEVDIRALEGDIETPAESGSPGPGETTIPRRVTSGSAASASMPARSTASLRRTVTSAPAAWSAWTRLNVKLS